MHDGPNGAAWGVIDSLPWWSVMMLTMRDSEEELERTWAFYRNESDKCASKLSGPPRDFRLSSIRAPPEAGWDGGCT
ncbi:unnamed protein product [Ectocarpus sp. 8 AP-2014]